MQATFFMTYILTSGWASLSFELLQPLVLLCNLFYRYVLRNKDESSYGTWTFPYHTEIPRVVLFGVMGFTCSIMAPLILPFLLVYFFLAYLVYRNQVSFSLSGFSKERLHLVFTCWIYQSTLIYWWYLWMVYTFVIFFVFCLLLSKLILVEILVKSEIFCSSHIMHAWFLWNIF